MSIDPANVGLFITLVGTLVGTTWKMATLVARVEHHVEVFEREAEQFKEIPLIRRDLAMVKDTLSRNVSDVRELREKRAASEAVARWTGGDFDKGR